MKCLFQIFFCMQKVKPDWRVSAVIGLAGTPKHFFWAKLGFHSISGAVVFWWRENVLWTIGETISPQTLKFLGVKTSWFFRSNFETWTWKFAAFFFALTPTSSHVQDICLDFTPFGRCVMLCCWYRLFPRFERQNHRRCNIQCKSCQCSISVRFHPVLTILLCRKCTFTYIEIPFAPLTVLIL